MQALEKLNALVELDGGDEDVKRERKHVAAQLCNLGVEAANELFKAGESAAAIAAFNGVVLSDCGDPARFAVKRDSRMIARNCV